jgi:hypothetical protein
MAASIVTASSGTSGSSLTPAYGGSGVTSGNMGILLCQAPQTSGNFTVTSDTRGSTWTALGAAVTASSGGPLQFRGFYTFFPSSGANTVTLDVGAEVVDTIFLEITGMAAATAPQGYVAVASGVGGSANPSSGNVTPSGAGLSIGWIVNDVGNLTFTSPLIDRYAISNFDRSESADVASNSSVFAASATATSRNWVAAAFHVLDAGAGGGGAAPNFPSRFMRGARISRKRRAA